MSFPLMPWVPETAVQKGIRFLGGVFQEATATVFTFSGVALSNPHLERIVVCMVNGVGFFGSTRTVSSVTVGGVSATLYQNVSNLTPGCIAVAAVPSGLSADVVVTFSGSSSAVCVGLWQLNKFNSAVPTVTNRVLNASQVTTLPSFTTPAGGASLFSAHNRSDNPIEWVNATEQYERTVTGRHGGAYIDRVAAGTSSTVNVSADSVTSFAKLVLGAAFS